MPGNTEHQVYIWKTREPAWQPMATHTIPQRPGKPACHRMVMFKASKDARHLNVPTTHVKKATAAHVHSQCTRKILNDTLYHIVIVSCRSIIDFLIKFQFQRLFIYNMHKIKVYIYIIYISMLHPFQGGSIGLQSRFTL